MTFIQWFWKSLYDRKVIAYSRFRQMTSTLWHVLFVILIASIPFFALFNTQTIQGVNQLQHTLQQDLPPFSIQNGVLKTNNDETFYIDHEEIGSVIIDPTATSSEDVAEHYNGIALVRDKVIMLERGEGQAIPYTLLGIQTLSNEDLLKRVSDLKGFLPVLLVIITVASYLGLLGIVFLGITVLSAFGIFLRGRRKVPYRQLWIMTAHALTLPVIALYWIDTLLITVPFILFLIATYVVLFFGMQAIPKPKVK